MEGELTLRLSRKDLEALAGMVAAELRPALRQPEPVAPDDELMTAKEVQALLKIKASTFYDWVKNKTLPEGVRLGSKLRRWRREDILKIKMEAIK